jgi:RNA polymerase sigma-70 factor, ECF subfamily
MLRRTQTCPLDSSSEHFCAYVRNRDPAQLAELLTDVLDRGLTQARRLLGSHSDAEDAVQNACIELVRTADRYDSSVPFAAWFGRLVHVAATRSLRARRRRQRYERDPGLARTGQKSAVDDETAELVRSAVAALPERYRSVFDLHFFAGLSYDDTARTLGLSESAVAMRLARGKQRLLRRLSRAGVVITEATIASTLSSGPVEAASQEMTATITKSLSTTAAPCGTGASFMVHTWIFKACTAAVAATVVFFSTGGWMRRDGDKAIDDAWGQEVNGLIASLRPHVAEFASGEPLQFDVVIKNVSPEKITLARDAVSSGWSLSLDSWQWHHPGLNDEEGLLRAVELEPGQSTTIPVTAGPDSLASAGLNFVWTGLQSEIRGPCPALPEGDYTVVARYMNENSPEKCWVGSLSTNAVTIKVSKDGLLHWGEPLAGLQLGIRVDQNPSAPGMAVPIICAFRNLSDRDFRVPDPRAFIEAITIGDEHDEEIAVGVIPRNASRVPTLDDYPIVKPAQTFFCTVDGRLDRYQRRQLTIHSIMGGGLQWPANDHVNLNSGTYRIRQCLSQTPHEQPVPPIWPHGHRVEPGVQARSDYASFTVPDSMDD